MNRLLVVGAGGHGAVVAEAAVESGRWENVEFLDDNSSLSTVVGLPVAGTLEQYLKTRKKSDELIVAIGDNRKRLNLSNEISDKGLALAIVIHPNSAVSPSASISPGTVVAAGVVVNARAHVGRACILNTSATVDHDCVLDDGVHVSPGANIAGSTSVGECTWIGVGSAIREGVRIGMNTVIGAGSAVVADIGDDERVGGVPAKRLAAK